MVAFHWHADSTFGVTGDSIKHKLVGSLNIASLFQVTKTQVTPYTVFDDL